MGFKITDYPAKTTFDDGDLYDVSTYDGVSVYTSEKMTFAELKTELNSALDTFYNENGSLTSARTVTLTAANTLTFDGGLTTFKGQDATSSNFAAKFQNTSSINLLTVRNDGFVGVFTSSPTANEKLRVNGNSNLGGSVFIGGASLIGNRVSIPAAWGISIGSTDILRSDSTDGTVLEAGLFNQIRFLNQSNENFASFVDENFNGISRDANGTQTTRDYQYNLSGAYWDGALSVQTTSILKHISEDTSGNAHLLVQGNGVDSAKFDDSSTAGDTRFFVYDVDNATLERVTVGAADSGGAGFKVLRIPN